MHNLFIKSVLFFLFLMKMVVSFSFPNSFQHSFFSLDTFVSLEMYRTRALIDKLNEDHQLGMEPAAQAKFVRTIFAGHLQNYIECVFHQREERKELMTICFEPDGYILNNFCAVG